MKNLKKFKILYTVLEFYILFQSTSCLKGISSGRKLIMMSTISVAANGKSCISISQNKECLTIRLSQLQLLDDNDVAFDSITTDNLKEPGIFPLTSNLNTIELIEIFGVNQDITSSLGFGRRLQSVGNYTVNNPSIQQTDQKFLDNDLAKMIINRKKNKCKNISEQIRLNHKNFTEE